jgi:hypothetical protein
MKQCTKCKKVLPLSDFALDKRAKSKTQSRCKVCQPKSQDKEKQKEARIKYMATPEGRAKQLLGSAKHRYYGCDLEITQEWLVKKLKKGTCEFTGLPFDFGPPPKGFSKNPYSPSLDRINSKDKTYNPENVRVVLSLVNLALNEFGEEIAAPVIKAMAVAMERI